MAWAALGGAKSRTFHFGGQKGGGPSRKNHEVGVGHKLVPAFPGGPLSLASWSSWSCFPEEETKAQGSMLIWPRPLRVGGQRTGCVAWLLDSEPCSLLQAVLPSFGF